MSPANNNNQPLKNKQQKKTTSTHKYNQHISSDVIIYIRTSHAFTT